MTLYWSKFFLTPSEVRLTVNTIEVNPLYSPVDRNSLWIIKELLNGSVSERNVGYNFTMPLIISADETSRLITISGETLSVSKWLRRWEDAKFRWIDDPQFEAAFPLRMLMASKPTYSRVNDEQDLVEHQYQLVTYNFTIV